jgi:hypothetical protein
MDLYRTQCSRAINQKQDRNISEPRDKCVMEGWEYEFLQFVVQLHLLASLFPFVVVFYFAVLRLHFLLLTAFCLRTATGSRTTTRMMRKYLLNGSAQNDCVYLNVSPI